MSIHSQSKVAPEVPGMGRPVVFWAVSGVGWLALTVYIFGTWMVSSDIRPVPVGNDPVPGNVLFWVHFAEIAFFSVGMVFLLKFVVIPLIRTRDIPIDGLLLLNFLLLWWTDPMDNYMNLCFAYNGYLVNVGSWANFIPGFSYPGQEKFAEPLFLTGGIYLTWWLMSSMVGCWVLRVMRKRWPTLGIGWGIAAVFAVISIYSAVTEPTFLRLGVWAFPGIPQSLALFPGKAYQYPLYQVPLIGYVCTVFTLLRYYRDDKGQLFVEKGLDRLNLSSPKKRLVTFLAIAGFVQPFFAIGYYLPFNLFAIHTDTAPALPSYLRTEMCGEGTEYACPSGEWVPIPRRGDKLYVRPDDPRLPQDVRDAQGIAKTGDPYREE